MVDEGGDFFLKKMFVDYLFVKGFILGVIFLYVDKRFVFGFLVGILIGVYI